MDFGPIVCVVASGPVAEVTVYLRAGMKEKKRKIPGPSVPSKGPSHVTRRLPTRPHLFKILPVPTVPSAGDQVSSTWALGDTYPNRSSLFA